MTACIKTELEWGLSNPWTITWRLEVGQNFTFCTSAIWRGFICLTSDAFWDIRAILLNAAPVRSPFLLKIKESFKKNNPILQPVHINLDIELRRELWPPNSSFVNTLPSQP